MGQSDVKKSCLDVNLFISDLVEICHKRRISLISICFDREVNGEITAEFFTREMDFEDGEILPRDIRKMFRDYIKSMIKRKRSEYIKEYNIDENSEFLKFYNTSPQSVKMREKGVFSIKTVISI